MSDIELRCLYWRVVDAKDSALAHSANLDLRRRQFVEELAGERRRQPSKEDVGLLVDGFAFANIDSIREEVVRRQAKAAAAKFGLVAIEVSKQDVFPTGGQ